MKADLFQSCDHCWVFQICWHIECRTFIASSFRIWNSSTGIPSPPLALFIVMLPTAHLTSHSRMSDFRWVITASWLSGSWRSFLYSSSVYSCYLSLISSASVRSIPLLSFIYSHFSCVQLHATLWTAVCQAPLPVGFSRQEYWSQWPFSPLGDLPDPGIEPTSKMHKNQTRMTRLKTIDTKIKRSRISKHRKTPKTPKGADSIKHIK